MDVVMRVAPRAIASRAALGLGVLFIGVSAAGGASTATTITVQVDGEGGTVVSSPPGISCPKTCSASFDSNATVTLTATVSSGHRLERWESDCDSGTGGTGLTCTVRLQGSNRSVGVLFLPAGRLQVAPRGFGAVAVGVSPVGIDAENGEPGQASCDSSSGDSSCELAYVPGTKVTLTPVPDPGGSFSDWSDPDCPGTGSCTVTVGDTPRSVAAFFSKLRLRVRLSEDAAGDAKVVSTPAGISCPPTCDQPFPPHSTVVLRITPPGHAFRRWEFGCVPNGDSCTVTMNDEPQWVGVTFDDEQPPQQPATIKVAFEVRKAGSGSGRVSSSQIDCGSKCSADYTFGTTVSLDAQADDGSTFAGWSGVCKQDKTCKVPVGPVTAVKATFERDTTAPSAPAELAVTAATRSSISIGWRAATDNVGVAGYGVYLNGERVATTSELAYSFDQLACGVSYTLGVDSVDRSGNRSSRSTLTRSTSPCAAAGLRLSVGGVTVKGRRVVVALRASRATSATLTLARGRAKVASRRYSLRAGSNTLALAVPTKAKAGSYRLTIAVRDPAGGSRVFTRAVRIRR